MTKHTLFGLISLECQGTLNTTLDKSRATELSEQMASELSKVLRLKPQTSLVVAAAGYPTESVLTPGFAVHRNLLQYASAAFQGEQQQHRVLAIGAHNGHMPTGLQPPATAAPLNHIPFVLITEDQAVAHRFEDTLLDKGMVSPPTYQMLQDYFGGTIVHANYMTHLDLIAMMHNHYDQVGMHHLWQIIESALLAKTPRLDLQQNRQAFYLRGTAVLMPFYTLQSYCRQYPDSSQHDYINWLMAQRLAAEVFQSHGLQTRFIEGTGSPQIEDDSLQTGTIKSFFYDRTQNTDQHPKQTQLVDYIDPKAGYVWTVLTETNGQQHWFYPLDQTAQKTIDAFLESEFGELYQSAHKQKQRLDERSQESSGCH